MKRLWFLLVCCFAFTSMARAAEKLTYVDLVHRLTDMEHVAVLPEPGEKTALASSYDRASRYDEATGKYIRWDANGDGGGIIRKEGDLSVMAEMNGPGCIWRIWSAAVGKGHVKIYLDGAAEPAVDLPFSGYFDHQNAPFIYPALVHTVSNGLNSYVPIPYQKSCKIVAEPGWGNYYHFNYTTFPAGTEVPTFHRDLAPDETAALAAADKLISDNLGNDPAGQRPGATAMSRNLTIPAGGTGAVATLNGPRAITALQVKLDPALLADAAKDELPTVLRNVVLRIRWDGEQSPSVWVPLGDFFGTAPGVTLYKSLPLGMTENGFYSYWYMPFARSANVEAVNEGATPVSLQLSLTHAPLTRPVAQLMRFHAKWHRDAFLPETEDRKIDWTMLKTQGRGRFVGTMLHIWNPKGGWWGEGDEKFFVDGEKFPSSIGTGSEDYFGYAWSSPKLFTHAYHNQPVNENNRGHISVNRWHISDSVPFQQSFEGDIEHYFGPECRYANTVYWYLAPDGNDPYQPVPADQRTGYYDKPKVTKVAGALEGEDLKVLEKTGGNAAPQDMSGYGGEWSGVSHLWWTGAKVGDKLTLAVPVKTAGKYEIKAQMTKARDYGIAQLYLDDQKLGAPIDFYHEGVIPTGVLSLGTMDLTAGDHKLTAEITGANDKADKAYMFGLDYVKLEPVK